MWRVGGRASKERWRTDLGLILKKKKFHHQSPSHCHLVWFPNPLAPDVCHHTATTPDIVCATATTTTTTTNGNAHLCMCVANEHAFVRLSRNAMTSVCSHGVLCFLRSSDFFEIFSDPCPLIAFLAFSNKHSLMFCLEPNQRF